MTCKEILKITKIVEKITLKKNEQSERDQKQYSLNICLLRKGSSLEIYRFINYLLQNNVAIHVMLDVLFLCSLTNKHKSINNKSVMVYIFTEEVLHVIE